MFPKPRKLWCWIITKKMIIPEILEKSFMVTQNFCGGPEILDQFLRTDRNAVHVAEILWMVV